jgi:hypothetical protein
MEPAQFQSHSKPRARIIGNHEIQAEQYADETRTENQCGNKSPNKTVQNQQYQSIVAYILHDSEKESIYTDPYPQC